MDNDPELSAVLRIKSVAVSTPPEGAEDLEDGGDGDRIPIVGKMRVERGGKVAGRYGFRGWAESMPDGGSEEDYEVVVRARVGRFNVDLTLDAEVLSILSALVGTQTESWRTRERSDSANTIDMPVDTAAWTAVLESAGKLATPIGGIPAAKARGDRIVDETKDKA